MKIYGFLKNKNLLMLIIYKRKKEKKMKFNINYWYTEEFLPTKRCRNLRKRYVEDSVKVDIKEVNGEEFPVAFIVHDKMSVFEGVKTYEDYLDRHGEWKMFDEEVRTYHGKLFKPLRVTRGTAISTCFEPLNAVEKLLEKCPPYSWDTTSFSENSIVVTSDIDSRKQEIFKDSEEYVIFENNLWESCSEPVYYTFYTSLNGDSYYIKYGGVLTDQVFNALETEHFNLGDNYIEVLIPEMVTKRLELSAKQAERVNAIHSKTLEYCKALSEDKNLELDMYTIDAIEKFVAEKLVRESFPVRFPRVKNDGIKQFVEEYYMDYTQNRGEKI